VRAPFRLARAAVVAGSTVLLAAAAHTAGGGALPDPLIFVGLLALTLLPAAWLCGRRVRPAAVLALLGTGQFVLHSAFDALSTAAAVSQFSPAAGHVHVLGTLPAGGVPAHGAHLNGESPAMLLAHALATLAVGLLLARGEAALWALLAWLSPLVRLLLLPALHPAPTVPAFAPQPLARLWRSLRLPSLRGPPAPSAA
jgi:hypothetical protein